MLDVLTRSCVMLAAERPEESTDGSGMVEHSLLQIFYRTNNFRETSTAWIREPILANLLCSIGITVS